MEAHITPNLETLKQRVQRAEYRVDPQAVAVAMIGRMAIVPPRPGTLAMTPPNGSLKSQPECSKPVRGGIDPPPAGDQGLSPSARSRAGDAPLRRPV